MGKRERNLRSKRLMEGWGPGRGSFGVDTTGCPIAAMLSGQPKDENCGRVDNWRLSNGNPRSLAAKQLLPTQRSGGLEKGVWMGEHEGRSRSCTKFRKLAEQGPRWFLRGPLVQGPAPVLLCTLQEWPSVHVPFERFAMRKQRIQLHTAAKFRSKAESNFACHRSRDAIGRRCPGLQ